jgi:hypothetical protein
MVKHIVIWTLRDEFEGLNKKQIAMELKHKLENLKGLIPEIKSLQFGINGAFPDRNADVVLVSEFENYTALDVYIAHPEHQKVGSFVKQVTTSRAAVDYEF